MKLSKAEKTAQKRDARKKAEGFDDFTEGEATEPGEEEKPVQGEEFMPKSLKAAISAPVDPDLLKERLCEKLNLTEGELSTLMDDFASEEQEPIILRLIEEKKLKKDEVKMYGLPTELFKKAIINRNEAEFMAGSSD